MPHPPSSRLYSTCEIQSSSSSFTDNIPLISTRGDTLSLGGAQFNNSAYHTQTGQHQTGGQPDHDDDIIGEEVRPPPVSSTLDAKLQILYAISQDHNYSIQNQVVVAAVVASTIATTTTTATTITTAAAAAAAIGSPLVTAATTSLSNCGILSSHLPPPPPPPQQFYQQHNVQHVHNVQQQQQQQHQILQQQQHNPPISNNVQFQQHHQQQQHPNVVFNHQAVSSSAVPKSAAINAYNSYMYNAAGKSSLLLLLLNRTFLNSKQIFRRQLENILSIENIKNIQLYLILQKKKNLFIRSLQTDELLALPPVS